MLEPTCSSPEEHACSATATEQPPIKTDAHRRSNVVLRSRGKDIIFGALADGRDGVRSRPKKRSPTRRSKRVVKSRLAVFVTAFPLECRAMRYRRHVFVCANTRPVGGKPSCGMRGGDEVVAALQRAIATSATLVGDVAVTPCGCLGPCFDGP